MDYIKVEVVNLYIRIIIKLLIIEFNFYDWVNIFVYILFDFCFVIYVKFIMYDEIYFLYLNLYYYVLFLKYI